jgi:5-formyltetrahydrofolate cyclo-ligase
MKDQSEPAREKAALRQQMREKRAALERSEAEAAAQRLAKGLPRHPLVKSRAPGAVLVPVRHRDEIDTAPLARILEDEGWRIHRPRSIEATRRLDAVAWATHAPLQAGAHGIPEPPRDAPRIEPETLSLIVVPGLAFGLDGMRLGSGLGYFDRFLAPLKKQEHPPVLIGIGYRFQLAPHVPAEPHDVPLDGLQLEERAVTCRPFRVA